MPGELKELRDDIEDEDSGGAYATMGVVETRLVEVLDAVDAEISRLEQRVEKLEENGDQDEDD
ncbi:hypothetical protein ACFFQF_00910 [Haladaptatus pallidirubidus]|uniref:Uncharacterized protein n=1 Tax=Haladaptatus pallidirubidus TaxID=1008152 RepID=A0AAV3UBB9_9EURY|nr:hypothetical protein [Haladaptatus pallidirubidus]